MQRRWIPAFAGMTNSWGAAPSVFCDVLQTLQFRAIAREIFRLPCSLFLRGQGFCATQFVYDAQ